MFQENNNVITIIEYILKKYPNAKRNGDKINFYTSVGEEYDSLKNGIGLRLISNPNLIEMKGKDVLDFLHRVTTNSVKDLKPFEVRNTLFLNEKGRFIDRTTLLSFENEFLLIGNNDKENRLISWINKFIITDDIITGDVSGKFAVIELIGKQSESYLTLLFGKDEERFYPNMLKKYDVDGFTFYFFASAEINKINTYKILIEKEKCIDFLDYLFSIKSVFDLSLAGDDAYNLFRIKNGLPSHPNEINDSTNPYEVNLINEINFKKGCYIGQEVIARLDTYDKIQRKMLQVETSNMNCHSIPMEIYNSKGEAAGEITSLINYDSTQEQIGLALLKKKALGNSNHFHVLVDGVKNSVLVYDLKV